MSILSKIASSPLCRAQSHKAFSTLKGQRDRHIEKMSQCIKVPVHGTTTERFKLKPGDVFKVNQYDLYVADPLSAIGYAIGANTSCRRGKDNTDAAPSVIVRVASKNLSTLTDKKRGLPKEELGYSQIGSGWWYIKSDTDLQVVEMYTVDKVSKKITPYLQELWPDKKKLNIEEMPSLETELKRQIQQKTITSF